MADSPADTGVAGIEFPTACWQARRLGDGGNAGAQNQRGKRYQMTYTHGPNLFPHLQNVTALAVKAEKITFSSLASFVLRVMFGPLVGGLHDISGSRR